MHQHSLNHVPYRAALVTAMIPMFLLLTPQVDGTEHECHNDCRSSQRPVGPTRPWISQDDLRNPLNLTHPYPHHIFAHENTGNEYSFAEFCNLGCTYFYASSGAKLEKRAEKSTLFKCIDQCDETYRYNISVGYSDLLEIARLECRDGCQMALKRCQPGYYCLQVSFDDVEFTTLNDAIRYSGGEMIPCPPGTYRDVSYDAVTQCIPCPAHHFREDIKGRSILGCSKCPAGTSADATGSTSIRDCVRCPAGTFSTESSRCECITPQACEKNQLQSPADTDKRETVPYAGLW